MTKEELKQEAEKWLRKFLLCNDCKRKCHCIELNAYCEEQVLKAYIDSAEPREKRIADLEAQIERNKIDLAISEHDREHNDYELTEAYKKIEQLEKENAELKADFIKSCKVKEQGFREAEQALERKDEQLTKAKDHIKKLLDCLKQDTNDPQTNYYVCQYMDKAEQFLSEVEK